MDNSKVDVSIRQKLDYNDNLKNNLQMKNVAGSDEMKSDERDCKNNKKSSAIVGNLENSFSSDIDNRETTVRSIATDARDLEAFLQKSIEKTVTVVSWETSSLLPPGENFASVILKGEAIIKRTSDLPEEVLHLVVKRMTSSTFQKQRNNYTAAFVKEIFVFEKLIPVFRDLEREFGLEEKDLIDLLPKYYGGRLTRDTEKRDQADEDAVLLMENLQIRDYYTKNKVDGLDFEHAVKSVEALARLHALGIATNQRKPSFFEEARKPMDYITFQPKHDDFDAIFDNFIFHIGEDRRIAKYQAQLKELFKLDNMLKAVSDSSAIEPWVTILHNDYWVNNILFHQSNGVIDDVKLIDFQLAKIGSPTSDLIFFIFTSTNDDLIQNYFDQLIDIYYQNLMKTLIRCKCNVQLFTKDRFAEQLKNDAKEQMVRILLVVQLIMLKVNDDFNLDDYVELTLNDRGNKLFLNRISSIISKYVEKKWL